jgi:ubiquinone/menaquinone biosynthesis C-methylase UbiE
MTGTERAYYDRRASEYDDFYLGTGLFAQRSRPGWAEELRELQAVLAALPFGSFLDVACGTGFLTWNLRGSVIALDQSASMLSIARARLPRASFIRGDGLALPFRSQQFDCLVTAHFYGHLAAPAARLFLSEARRVARSIVIVDAAKRDEVPFEEQQERVLNDGSRDVVYKRYFAPEQLISEIGAGRVLHAGHWFVALQAPAQSPPA